MNRIAARLWRAWGGQVDEHPVRPVEWQRSRGAGQEASPIVWPTKVFFSGDNPDSPAPLAADLTGGARILYYGPYLHLPAGRWTARMLVGFSAGSRGTPFSIEVYGSKLLARATMVPQAKGIFTASFKFSNDAPYDAIEIRVRTDRGAIEGQFALGRGQFLLAGINAARRKFPQIVVCGVAILALEEHARHSSRLIDGQYNDGTRMMNEISAYLDATRFQHVIGADPEDRSTVYRLRGDEAGLGSPSAAGLGS